MTEDIFVDPDSLTAVAEVADRQRGHLADVSDFIADACSQFGAFSGVLNLFEGQYRDAVTTAQSGMTDARTVAQRVREATLVTRTEFLDTDKAQYDEFRRLFGDVGGLPPYVPPGSGQSVPGEPVSMPERVAGGGPDDPFELPKGPGLPPYLSGPADRIHNSPDERDLPWYVNPSNTVQDHIRSEIQQHRMEQEYLDLREQGYSPQEARDIAQRNADSIASEHSYDVTEGRAADAYDRAYDDARDAGGSEDDARTAGQDAAAESRSNDAVDRGRRQDILDDGRTLLDTYDEVNDVIDNVNSINDGVHQLDETLDDLDDYDDYEGSAPDRSAQDWAEEGSHP